MSDYFTPGAVPIHGKSVVTLAAAGSVSIPQGAIATRIVIRNKTVNAVTGGIKVGTAAAGVDVLAAGAVAASALVAYLPLISASNIAAVRTLFIDAVTAWNGAVVDVSVEYTDLV